MDETLEMFLAREVEFEPLPTLIALQIAEINHPEVEGVVTDAMLNEAAQVEHVRIKIRDNSTLERMYVLITTFFKKSGYIPYRKIPITDKGQAMGFVNIETNLGCLVTVMIEEANPLTLNITSTSSQLPENFGETQSFS